VTPPTAVVNFTNTLASSYSTLGPTTENVSFSSLNPLQMYLEVPGIPGESSTPGHANIMQIVEFTLAGDFSVLRASDTASDDLFLASAQGTHFPTANLLLYNSAPAGPPDAILSFSDLLVSAYSSVGGQPVMERVTFNYANLLPQVPEPGTAVLVGVAVVGLSSCTRRVIIRENKTAWYSNIMS
jgi:type VI protein secretion system component Hcp